MAAKEFGIPTFELSEEAQHDADILHALAVPVEVRWSHLGEANTQMARELLVLRSQLEAQGVPAADREMALITFVNEVHHIKKLREARANDAPSEVLEIDTVEPATVVDLAADKEKKRRLKPRRLWRLGAAAMTLGLIKSIKDDYSDTL